MRKAHASPYLIVRLKDAASDDKVRRPGNNGRKVTAIALRPESETRATATCWKSAHPARKTPVVETGMGGIEVSTFTHTARQDRHKHARGTECYTVLAGRMKARVGRGRICVLDAGDELLVFPGTVHEILTEGEFLTRVHSVNCFGVADKFVEKDGARVAAAR
jgi:quercetin dioxygenase-like cupin family protein